MIKHLLMVKHLLTTITESRISRFCEPHRVH